MSPATPPSLPRHSSARAPRRSHAERSAATRDQLLQATAALVHERSFHAASMFEVAKAAGVTPGALQHHFGSKAELMMQVIEHVMQSDQDDGVRWPDAGQPLARRARLFVQALWAGVYEPPRFLTAWSIYFGSRDEAALGPRIAERRRRLSAALHARCLAIFPELGRGAAARAFVDLLLSSLRGIAIVRLFDRDDPALQAQLRELAHLIELRCGAASDHPSPPPSRRSSPR